MDDLLTMMRELTDAPGVPGHRAGASAVQSRGSIRL